MWSEGGAGTLCGLGGAAVRHQVSLSQVSVVCQMRTSMTMKKLIGKNVCQAVVWTEGGAETLCVWVVVPQVSLSKVIRKQ